VKTKSISTRGIHANVFYRRDRRDNTYELCMGSAQFADSQWFDAGDLEELSELALKLARKLRQKECEL